MLSGVNLVTTVIGFGMSATFIVLICFRLICCGLRAANSHTATPFNDFGSSLDQPEHRISGLEPVLIAVIPTMEYKHEAFSASEDPQCSICLDEYKNKEMLRILPSCHHDFHLDCIDVWLQQQSTCPICRLPLHELLEAKYAATTLLGAQMMDSPSYSSHQHNQWLLPSGQWPEWIENNQESYGSVSATIGSPHRGNQEDRS